MKNSKPFKIKSIGQSKAILLEMIDTVPDMTDEYYKFFQWYYSVHISALVKEPGFLCAHPLIAIDGPTKYLTIYELKSMHAINEAVQRRWLSQSAIERILASHPEIKNINYKEYEQVYPRKPSNPAVSQRAKGMLAIMLQTEPDMEEEFNKWYMLEHLPLISAVPNILRFRRYFGVESYPKYLSLLDLGDIGILYKQEYLSARDSPWTSAIVPRLTGRVRYICVPIGQMNIQKTSLHSNQVREG